MKTATKTARKIAPRATAIALTAALAIACQNSGTNPAPTAPPAPPTGAEAPQQWTMPDLVGRNLQEAQDQIQTVTGNSLFLTRSHDATGQNRNQVVDSNWKVCTQNVAPGSPFNGDTLIDLGTVQLTESCP